MAIILLILIGTLFLLRKRTAGLHTVDLPVSWGLKIVASLIFLYVYSHYYGSGTLTADPSTFMYESGLLAQVAANSVPDYLRFLFGMETPEMVVEHLSSTIHWTAGDLTLINDSKNVIRINSLLYLLSGGNIYFHLFFLNLLSLLGARELYLAFQQRMGTRKRLFWYSLLLLPSIIFWTSSILKEPLLIAGLALVLRAWMGELPLRQSWWRWLLGILLMIGFKPYVLLCLLPALLLYYLSRLFFSGKVLIPLGLLFAATVLFLSCFPQKRAAVTHRLTRFQFDFVNVGKGGIHAYADTCFFYFRPDQFRYLKINPGNDSVRLLKPLLAKKVKLGKAHPFADVYLQPNKQQWYLYYYSVGCRSNIEVTSINSSFPQLLKNIPEALVNASFRPFFGDPGGRLKYFSIIETLFLFSWVIYRMRSLRSADRITRLQIVSLWLFALLLLLLIGWTTPVLGAIVRYRIPAYLALFLSGWLIQQKSETKL